MVVNLNQAHSNMVVQQVRPGDVLDNDVLSVMSTIPREHFVDEELAALAYADTELPIGCGQVMLTPTTEGRLLQALQLKKTDQVLEIGTGSGYFTALLAKLANQVVSVEIYAELSKLAAENLAKLEIQNVELQVGDASKSWPISDRVDVIVTTAALPVIPDEFLQQLKVGGHMLAVVGNKPAMQVQKVQRISEWEWQTETLYETVIPEMVNAEAKPEFEF